VTAPFLGPDGDPRCPWSLGDSIDDCGHVQGSADPNGEHRGHPHLFRITTASRQAGAGAT
jgi:hypothetical protein